MNLNKNYYSILGVANNTESSDIKKAYYKLSFKYHPDYNKDPEVINMFSDITEAYNVLMDERENYDLKSKYGNNYNEYYELLTNNVNFDYEFEKEKMEKFKKNEVLNVYINVDDSFDGSVEYERWVKCKTCDGTGKDLSSKIVIRDNDGNVLKTFDADDGCDFCDGVGKYMGQDCSFCFGKGKIGMTACSKCEGNKRFLGKQKMNGLKIKGSETKIDAMGHHSKDEPGKVGSLILIKKVIDN